MKLATRDLHVPDPALFPELQGDDTGFEASTIRAEDATIAVEMLIGNYSAPIDAVIRELTINAIDAHRAAGQSAPVRITMPTLERPMFVVSDSGLGLSPTDMVGVYTRPAASTKRGENSSTGGLGIGAKAPFTITDRFVVIGTKGDVSATLVLARIDGQLMHAVRDQRPARDEPNGVTVSVPVEPTEENILAWHKALSRVHFWWDAGLVEVTNAADIRVPLPTWQERLLAPDDIAPVELPGIIIGKQVRTSMVLMGQIAYQIPADVAPTTKPTIYRLPVGTVSIAPTRESIVANAQNQAVLRKLLLTQLQILFAGVATAMADPTTSLWTLQLIRAEIGTRGLLDHFLEWCRHARANLVAADRLPSDKHRFQRLFDYCFPWDGLKISPKYSALVYGDPNGGAARAVPFMEILDGASAHNVVFVDGRALPERKRKILTRWAREAGVLAVTVDRSHLESIKAKPNFVWSRNDVALTRPFADPGQLTWIDPADITVEQAPKKPSVKAGLDSQIQIIETHLSWVKRDVSVGELLTRIKGKRNRWAIVDTKSALGKLPGRLPEHIVRVTSGQPAAALVREQLGTQAVTVEEFLLKQHEIVLNAMTPTQRRWVADYEVARRPGLMHFFANETAWIDDTTDADVRKIARKISKIVTEANTHRFTNRRDVAKNEDLQRGVAYQDALRTLRQDETWLLENGALGAYAPALIAAESSGLLGRWQRESSKLIPALIRTAIASQL